MRHIFISNTSIDEPDTFTRYITSEGTSYQRMESEITPALFIIHPTAIRIELYRNSKSNMVNPVMIAVLYRFDCEVKPVEKKKDVNY